MMKIKKGDTVRIIHGKDRNSEGKIIAIDHKKGRVMVEGCNMIKKHEKPSMRNQNGGIVTKEAFLDASNVMYLHNGKPTRIGIRMENGQKVRYAKSTGETISVITTHKREVR